MKYKSLIQAAQLANARSRMCKKCPYKLVNKVCSAMQLRICSDAFVEGFTKGAKWCEKTRQTDKK